MYWGKPKIDIERDSLQNKPCEIVWSRHLPLMSKLNCIELSECLAIMFELI